jgi:hypothetical protein
MYFNFISGLIAVVGQCLPSYYCPVGSKSATEVICTAGYYCPLGTETPLLHETGTILPSTSEITAIKNAKKITHINLESNREYAIFQFHTFFTWSCDISHSCRLTVISLCTITALGFHTQSLYIRVSTSRTGRWCFCSQWAVVTSSTDDLIAYSRFDSKFIWVIFLAFFIAVISLVEGKMVPVSCKSE